MTLSKAVIRFSQAMGGGRQPVRFFYGGTASPFVASSAACIGVSQPPEQLNVDLSGVIPLFTSDKGITGLGETSPPRELSGVYTKLSEDLEEVV